MPCHTSAIGQGEPLRRLAVLRTVDEVAHLREFWSSCRGHRDADIDFYLLALADWPGAVRPHVIVLYRGDQPSAILIGWLERRRLEIGFSILNALMPRVRTLALIHGGLTGEVSPAEADLLVESIREALRGGEATMAVFDRLDVTSPLYEAARRSPGFFIADHTVTPQIHRAMRVAMDTKSFLACLSSHERSNQRRRERRLTEKFPGRLRIERYCDASEVERLMEDVETVSRTTYMRGLGRGFSNVETIRRRVELEARKGTLRGYLLYLNDRPCSYWIRSVYDGVCYSGWMGYDRDYREYSVGMFLVIKAIDDLVASGVRFFDFDSGNFPWKELLCNESWEEASVCIFAPTLKGYTANAVRTMAVAGLLPMKVMLRRSGLLQRIQRSRGYRAAARAGSPVSVSSRD